MVQNVDENGASESIMVGIYQTKRKIKVNENQTLILELPNGETADIDFSMGNVLRSTLTVGIKNADGKWSRVWMDEHQKAKYDTQIDIADCVKGS